jgi:hypothetical protein
MPFGIGNYEAKIIEKLRAQRGPGESYSEAIIWLAAVGHESLNGS